MLFRIYKSVRALRDKGRKKFQNAVPVNESVTTFLSSETGHKMSPIVTDNPLFINGEQERSPLPRAPPDVDEHVPTDDHQKSFEQSDDWEIQFDLQPQEGETPELQKHGPFPAHIDKFKTNGWANVVRQAENSDVDRADVSMAWKVSLIKRYFENIANTKS